MLRQRRVIWFAIVMSTFIYALLVYMMSRDWPPPSKSFDEAVRDPRTLILYGMALFTFVLAFIVRRAISVPQSAFVTTLAIFEASAIFGLLAAFLAQDWRLYLAPWALALMGFVREFPGREEAYTSQND